MCQQQSARISNIVETNIVETEGRTQGLCTSKGHMEEDMSQDVAVLEERAARKHRGSARHARQLRHREGPKAAG